MLNRLAASNDAARAFETILIDNFASANRLLLACIEAELLARTFKRNKTSRAMIAQGGLFDRLDEAVRELRKFLEDTRRRPSDQLAARISYHHEDITKIDDALRGVADMIDVRRRIEKETMLRLGATRKIEDGGKAGETAAIGWLAVSVRRMSQRAHHRSVADLAVVVLDCGDVTIERVSKAEQTQQRQWRVPLKYARSG
jgi:hypothetical protein